MVGLNPEIGALYVGVRIYGDVWQSGTLEALSDRSVRGLSKLVANSRVSTPPALFMLVSTNGYDMCIYMGTCMCLSQGDIIPTDGECVHLFIYLFIYCIRTVYWYDGVIDPWLLFKVTS